MFIHAALRLLHLTNLGCNAFEFNLKFIPNFSKHVILVQP